MTDNQNELKALRYDIIKFMGAKRYMHTLGVERAAVRLGSYFDIYDLYELSSAALLHDIAKEMDTDTQLSLIRQSGIILTDEDIKTPTVLHSLAAPGALQKFFPGYATDKILSSVFAHTVAKADMSIFDAIIFIADFIEDGREYTACKQIAKELYSALENAEKEDRDEVLRTYLLKIIDFTIEYLNNRNMMLNSRLLVAKNDLLSKKLQV